jgi:pimeloyl-ACP methyl ester carboxylesterase
VRRQSNGSWQVNYDLRIAEPFKAFMAAGQPQDLSASEPSPMLLWPLYDAISCPTLLLRGALSDLLTAEVAQAMTQRGPKAELEEVPKVGHAPSLVTPEQINLVHQFLK